MNAPPIYVEIRIHGSMDEIWRLTQTPDQHQRWDLRFTEIQYLPRAEESSPQKFLYATRIGFGLRIAGEGESLGESDGGGGRVSALRFWSDDPKSLIREGAGYWRYIPAVAGLRFLTRYDYRTRFGAIGKTVDRLIFRPLLGWATAWSFDRLRLWIEHGISPETSLERSLVHAVARSSLALIWVYQGVVPKLLFQDSGELEILRSSGMVAGHEGQVLIAVGIGEVLFGLLHLALWRRSRLFVLDIVLLALLAAGALFSQPAIFVAPFNPVTLTLAMVALAIVGMTAQRRLPSARRCLRREPRENE